MTVTKQQQLEWLASMWTDAWVGSTVEYVDMSVLSIGVFCTNPIYQAHRITREEWQQERDRQAELKAMVMQMCELKPLERHKLSNKPEVDNSWHERGEFPPAGCECEVKYAGKWIATSVIGMSPYGWCVFTLNGSFRDHLYDGMDNPRSFRPLRTEREKAIDEMISVTLAVINQDTQRQMFGMLYDSGYRKVKP